MSDSVVVIAGGEDEAGPLDTVELYDSSGGSTSVARMTQPRSGAACAALPDGRVLVTGGNDGSRDLDSAEIYDPKRNTWTPTGPMLQARRGHIATTTPLGLVLIAGGEVDGRPTDQLEAYLLNGEFKPAGQMSVKRSQFAWAPLPDRKVVIAGGTDGRSALSSIDIWDADTFAVTPGGAMLTPRSHFSASPLPDGRLLFSGGLDASGDAAASAELYDAARRVSVIAARMPQARAGHVACVLPHNGQVLVLGGRNAQGVLGTSVLYRPWRDKWIEMSPLRFGRTVPVAAALRRRRAILVAGGRDDLKHLRGTEMFGYATIETDKAGYAAGESVLVSGSGWKPGERVRFEVASSHNTQPPEFTGDAVADASGDIHLTGIRVNTGESAMKLVLTAYGDESQAQGSYQTGNLTTVTLNAPTPASPSAFTNPRIPVQFTGNAIDLTIGRGFMPPDQTVAVSLDGAFVTNVSAFPGSGAFSFTFDGSTPAVTLLPGIHTIGVQVNASTQLNQSNLVTTTYQVSAVGTATSMTGGNSSVAFGNTAPLSAVVSATVAGAANPGGSVTFSDGIGTSVVSTSSAPGVPAPGSTTFYGNTPPSLTLNNGNPHQFTAAYSGVLNVFTGSNSNNSINVTVVGSPVALSVTTQQAVPLGFGSPLVVTAVATSAAGGPFGTVTFLDNNSIVAGAQNVTMAGGTTANVNITGLAPGVHVITAQFTPAANSGFLPANSGNSATVTVAAGPTTTALTPATATGVLGAAATFTATVAGTAGTPPDGFVSFYDTNHGNGLVGSCTLTGAGNASSCSLSTSALAGLPFLHIIQAKYQGSVNFAASTGPTTSSYTVTPATPTFSLTTSPSPASVAFQSVAVNATVIGVNGVAPTGAVQLVVRGSSMPATATLVPVPGTSNATATLTAGYGASGLVLGSNTISLSYNGDSNYVAVPYGSGTPVVNFTVNPAPVNIAVITNNPVSRVGESVTFTATLSSQYYATPPGVPSFNGVVDFLADGGVVAGCAGASLNGTSASCTTASLPGKPSPVSISVAYRNDTLYASASSPAISQTVNPANVSLVLSSNSASVVLGQAPLLTVAASSGGGAPTGSVVFKDGAATLCATTLSSGTASCSPTGTPPLAGGAHNIQAFYNPTTPSAILTFASNVSSNSVQVNVAAGAVAFSGLASSKGNAYPAAGNPTTLSVNIGPATAGPGQPAVVGTVDFFDGSAKLGSGAVTAGSASLPNTILAPGPHNITVGFTPADTNYLASAPPGTPQISVTVSQNTTTVTLSNLPNPSVQYGSGFPVGVTVSPNAQSPTGTVALTVNGNQLGSVVLAAGNAGAGTINVSAASAAAFLAVGANSVTAMYAGDANNAASSGAGVVNLIAAASAITVSASPNPSNSGQSVTLTATVANANTGGAGKPAGTVTFREATTGIDLGAFVLSDGMASVTTNQIPPGNARKIRVAYAPGSNEPFLPVDNAGSLYNMVVNPGQASVAPVSSKSVSAFGETVTLTATATAFGGAVGTPSGTVQFQDGGVSIGSPAVLTPVAVSPGQPGQATAAIQWSFQNSGTRAITAIYAPTPGDPSFAAPVGPPSVWVQQVLGAATTTTLALGPAASSVFGQTVTLTAAVASAFSGSPTGHFEFYDGSALIGVTALPLSAPFQSAISTKTLQVASGTVAHSLTAKYVPDDKSNFTGSTSTASPFTVSKADTTISPVTITAGNPASGVGKPLTFSASVTVNSPGAGNPTGAVTFFADGNPEPIGAGALNGNATVAYQTLPAGPHFITAVYSGDANFGAAANVPASLSINIAKSSPSITVTSDVAAPVYGQAYSLTATLEAANGFPFTSGTVSFQDTVTNTVLCAAVPVSSAGVARCSQPAGAGGLAATSAPHLILATYSGDGNYNPASNAPGLPLPIGLASVRVDLGSSSSPAVLGQPVTFTAQASVVPPGVVVTLGGAITFLDGGKPIPGCTNTPVNASGQAVCTFGGGMSIGLHSIQADYSGDAGKTQNLAPQMSQPFSQQVNPAAVTVTITGISPNPAPYSASLTYSVSVSAAPPAAAGTPTGSVTVVNGVRSTDPAVGTCLLSAGTCSLSARGLTAGTYGMTAFYGGDSGFAKGNSEPLTLTIQQAESQISAVSATTLSPPAVPIFGQPVKLSATVTALPPATGVPQPPLGTVTFFDAGNPIGSPASVDPASGIASITTSSLIVGIHGNLTASYSGDANFKPVTNAVGTVLQVKPADTAVVLTPIAPAVYGASVTLSAVVSAVAPGSGSPRGTVEFYDGSVVATAHLGRADLAGSSLAVLTVAALPSANSGGVFENAVVGSHQIIAVFVPNDSNFNSSTSSQSPLQIGQATTATTISSQSNPSVIGQAVLLTATVLSTGSASGSPTGTVQFFDGGSLLGTVALSTAGGQSAATLTVPGPGVTALSAGNHSISARYQGDANYTASSSPVSGQSGALMQVVTPVATTTTLTSAPNASTVGQAVMLTATVSAQAPGQGVPTGQVQFLSLDSQNVTGAPYALLGTATLSPGPTGSNTATAVFTASMPSSGRFFLRATYAGDASMRPSDSGQYTHAVNKPATVVLVSSSLNPSILGQTIVLTATITPGPPATGVPTGTVQFLDGSLLIGAAQLAGGQATLSVQLPVGTHSIAASFGGDTNYQGAMSVSIQQSISAIPSALTITASSTTALASQPITVRATVSPAAPPGVAPPSGQVRFLNGSQILGVAPLNSGVAAFTLDSLAAGSHNIVGSYLGDQNWMPSDSASIALTVDRAQTAAQVATSAERVVFGQPVSLTINVVVNSPGTTPSKGQVLLYDNGAAIGDPVPAASGKANITVPGFAVGLHKVTAMFLADDSFEGSTSPVLALNVEKASTVTVMAALPKLAGTGRRASLTAVVSALAPGSGAPAGSIQFLDTARNKVLGTVQVGFAGDVCSGTLETDLDDAGTPPAIQAIYSGDANFAASSSAPAALFAAGSPIAVLNGAGYLAANVAPDAFMTIFGSGFAETGVSAAAFPYPSSLGGMAVAIKDAAGTSRDAGLMYAGPGQINVVMPADVALGLATVTVTGAHGSLGSTMVLVTRTAPGLFSANGNGKGVAAAQLVRVSADGSRNLEPVAEFAPDQSQYVPLPVDFGPDTDQLFLVVYGTGFRHLAKDKDVTARIGGVPAKVLFAGAQGSYPGLDQANIEIPRNRGLKGEAPLVLLVDGQESNPITVSFGRGDGASPAYADLERTFRGNGPGLNPGAATKIDR